MGLFGRGPKRTGRVLRASGMRIDTGNRAALQAIQKTQQDWQRDAWGYRDMIGELRFAVQFLARAVSRVRFLPAQVLPDEDEPIPLTSDQGVDVPADLKAACEEELARLPLDAGYSFLGVLSENLKITGEVWIHGYEQDGEERWEALSTSEVEIGIDGKMSIRRATSAAPEPVNPDAEEMLRLWVPHPQYKVLADSAMRALLGPCEDVVLAGREIRAASRSRFAANGLLKVPNGLTMMRPGREENEQGDENTFLSDLTAALLAPISNEGDPGAVVPGIVTGEASDLDGFEHMRFDREDSPTLLDKIDKALARIARGLDIPPEIITGVAEANHWSAWQIDASTYRYHIDPDVRTVADSLTEGFLRPALRARGFTVEQSKQVQVWYDAGSITENPNRGQDARDAFNAGAIGYETFRQALGFNDSDAPTDEEVLRMVAFKIGVDPSTASGLLQVLFGNGNTAPAVQAVSERADGEPQPPADDTPADTGQTSPQEGQTPPQTPDSAAPSVGAQRLLRVLLADSSPEDEEPGDDAWIVDTESGRKLMDIDRAERERLLVAADAALARALEKAGARIKSRAQKNAAMRERIVGMDGQDVARLLGRTEALALGQAEEELLGDALDALQDKFTSWVAAAIGRTVQVVLALLRIDPDSARGRAIADRLESEMSERVGAAWSRFRDALMDLAEQWLFSPQPDEEPGEAPDSMVPPGLVRDVLAEIGGTPPGSEPRVPEADRTGQPPQASRPQGGIALGETVTSILEDNGVQELGFEWVYGITPVRHFEPHLEMDGKRFGSWADPALVPPPQYAWVGPVFTPGDHKGCMCDYMPSYAIPEAQDVEAERLGEDSGYMAEERRLAEEDDRAGRTGTTAQANRDERDRIARLRSRWINREN